MDLLDELESRVVCGDGAMGTLLLNEGFPIGQCLEELCVSTPGRIQSIHEEYVAAGARVIETNSFGANAVRLSRFGLESKVDEINRAAVRVAQRAAKGRRVYVAGSVGPLGITGDEAAGRGINRTECFSQQLAAQLDEGVDLIFFETFMDLKELEIALQAIKSLGDLPTICSFACAADGRLASGVALNEAFARAHRSGADIVGMNCMNDPREMLTLLAEQLSAFPLAVYPTAGNPRHENDRLVYKTTPEMFGEGAREIAARGGRLVGGCCGTTPAHIAAISAALLER